jgi:hypothetical protein
MDPRECPVRQSLLVRFDGQPKNQQLPSGDIERESAKSREGQQDKLGARLKILFRTGPRSGAVFQNEKTDKPPLAAYHTTNESAQCAHSIPDLPFNSSFLLKRII